MRTLLVLLITLIELSLVISIVILTYTLMSPRKEKYRMIQTFQKRIRETHMNYIERKIQESRDRIEALEKKLDALLEESLEDYKE